MTSSEFERAALDYLQRGWSVIALRKRDKRPAVAWQDFQSARASERQVRDWFIRWPEANVGIVTGAVSRLVVLDVDPRHGGEDSLRRIEREHGPLPQTLEAVTGGGGRHLYFLHPGGVVRNRVGLAPGIDLRGDGGCIVAPPSLHPCGRRYQWVKARRPGQLQPARLPHWLQSSQSDAEQRAGHPLTHWRELLRQGVPEGQRNNSVASITGHLLWHGVDAEVVLELMLCWNRSRCRPPLDDGEVARTVQSITRMHEQRADED